jgi:hypothetical protein
MPDEQQPDSPVKGEDTVIEADAPTREVVLDGLGDADEEIEEARGSTGKKASGPLLSAYGWASAVLGVACVAAVVFGAITWSMHRDDLDERNYRGRVLQTAASWTSVLINLNAENVEKGMQRLHDKTAGQLNSEFEAALEPYRDVVQRIQSRSTGRIEAVALETEHHDLDAGADATDSTKQPPPGARRTDPVMVIATSIAENVGGKPQTVHWALLLDVSDVDGQLLISQLRSIR